MADALASGASVLRDVGVQVPLRPPRKRRSGLRSMILALFAYTPRYTTDLRGFGVATDWFATMPSRRARIAPSHRDRYPSRTPAPRASPHGKCATAFRAAARSSKPHALSSRCRARHGSLACWSIPVRSRPRRSSRPCSPRRRGASTSPRVQTSTHRRWSATHRTGDPGRSRREFVGLPRSKSRSPLSTPASVRTDSSGRRRSTCRTTDSSRYQGAEIRSYTVGRHFSWGHQSPKRFSQRFEQFTGLRGT